MIEAIGAAQRTLSPTVLSLDRIAGGKQSIPVRPAFSIYLFKHVMGVPARSRESQVPIDKLRMLDTMIDRLMSLRGGRGEGGEVLPVTRDNIDPLIQRVQAELHGAVRASAPLFSGLFSGTGLVVNLLA